LEEPPPPYQNILISSDLSLWGTTILLRKKVYIIFIVDCHGWRRKKMRGAEEATVISVARVVIADQCARYLQMYRLNHNSVISVCFPTMGD